MPSQLRVWQQGIIRAAQRSGELSSLFWVVEMEAGGKFQIATYPRGRIPVLPLAPDPTIALEWAHMLMLILEDAHRGEGKQFALALLDRDLLNSLGRPWYVYGSEDDQQTN